MSSKIIDDIEIAYKKLIAEKFIKYVHSLHHWSKKPDEYTKKHIRLGLQ